MESSRAALTTTASVGLGGWLSRAVALDVLPGALLLAALVAVPCLVIGAIGNAPVVLTATNFLVMLVAVLGLAVFSGNSGIMSFGMAGFMALGAQISATLTSPPAIKASTLPDLPVFLQQSQLGFIPAVLVAAVIVAAVAYLAGLVIMRMSETSASIATLGFLIIVNSLIIGAQGITRGSQAMYGVPKLIDLPLAVALAAIAIVAVRLYRDSVPGLKLRAVRDNEAAARASGIDAPAVRLAAWVVGAVLSAVAGAMFAHMLTVFSAKEFYFELTFAVIVMLVVGGTASVLGAAAGAVLITLLIEVLRRLENGFSLGFVEVPQFFGLTQIGLSLAILAVLYRRRTGLFGSLELENLWRGRKSTESDGASFHSEPAAVAAGDAPLTVTGVSKSYGGLVAVDDVSLTVGRGEIVGLIGPNGSGKTTLLGCIAGTHEANAGAIAIGDQPIVGLPPHKIARAGIGRTFQTVRLFASLSVSENVVAALAQAEPTLGRRQLNAGARQLLDECGVGVLADRAAGTLAYGQQRRVEIARALAIRPAFLLLDEPAAGMNDVETASILGTLRALVRQRRIGLLIVDHDMNLIMSLCDRITVLNRGKLIASGPPTAIQSNPAVQDAYLGRRRKTA